MKHDYWAYAMVTSGMVAAAIMSYSAGEHFVATMCLDTFAQFREAVQAFLLLAH